MGPPAWARRLADAGGGYLLLDELFTASPMVHRLQSVVVVVTGGFVTREFVVDGFQLLPRAAGRRLIRRVPM